MNICSDVKKELDSDNKNAPEKSGAFLLDDDMDNCDGVLDGSNTCN
jgi:hypothetical protein